MAALARLLLLAGLSCASLPLPERLPGVGGFAPDAAPSVDLPAPQAVRAQDGELRAVPLSWQPVLGGDVAGYVVERAEQDDEAFTRIGAVSGRLGVTYVDEDPTLADGATYRYRLRSVDSQGRVGHPTSVVASASTAPPPSAPEQLEATSHLPRRVALQWRPATDPRIVGYVLERSPAADGPFTRIADIRGRFDTSHVDRELGDLRVFYYRVAAVSAAGAEGPRSDPVQAVTKAEPLPPIGLRVAVKRLGANTLSWKPNAETDLAGYRLLRTRGEGRGPEVVAVLDPRVVEAEDRAVASGEAVAYRLVAFDSDGLESVPSDAVEVRSEDYGLRADTREDGIALRWNPRPDEGFAATRVFRVGTLRRREVARVEGDRFVDTHVEAGRSYRYAVVLERADGTRAPVSGVVESRAGEAAAP